MESHPVQVLAGVVDALFGCVVSQPGHASQQVMAAIGFERTHRIRGRRRASWRVETAAYQPGAVLGAEETPVNARVRAAINEDALAMRIRKSSVGVLSE
jgi:hypothetical protein